MSPNTTKLAGSNSGISSRLVWMLGLFGWLLLTMSTSAHAIYWNVFNIEGESSASANIVTYDTLTDMLNDTNRLGLFVPDGFGFGSNNIIGAGSDGSTYWNVFNIEGESSASANIVTYDTLTDMLNDTNRTGLFVPDGFGFGSNNIVGGGAELFQVSSVPIPPAVILFGTGVLGLVGVARRKESARTANVKRSTC